MATINKIIVNTIIILYWNIHNLTNKYKSIIIFNFSSMIFKSLVKIKLDLITIVTYFRTININIDILFYFEPKYLIQILLIFINNYQIYN